MMYSSSFTISSESAGCGNGERPSGRDDVSGSRRAGLDVLVWPRSKSPCAPCDTGKHQRVGGSSELAAPGGRHLSEETPPHVCVYEL